MLVVDGHNLYWICGGNDTPTIVGEFIIRLACVIQKVSPTFVIVVWDGGKSDYRVSLLAEYKSKRHTKEVRDVRQDVGKIEEILSFLNVSQFRIPGWEADDLIYYLKYRYFDSGEVKRMVIFSSDKDFYQIVESGVSILPRYNSEEITIENFESITGYASPEMYKQCKVLIGDSSDTVSGIQGIGESRAKELITKYGSIEKAVDSLRDEMEKGAKLKWWQKNLLEGEDIVERNKKILWFNKDMISFVSDDALKRGEFNREEAFRIIFNGGIFGLLLRLPQVFQTFEALRSV